MAARQHGGSRDVCISQQSQHQQPQIIGVLEVEGWQYVHVTIRLMKHCARESPCEIQIEVPFGRSPINLLRLRPYSVA